MADQFAQLLSLNPGARFRKADLHVHTPASIDIHESWREATPSDLVDLALAAGLEIIAITDHNSAGWCDAMTAAAAGSGLSVFPGVELSTPEGHLLAIFELGTSQGSIGEFLVEVGIGKESWGDLDIATKEHIEDICRRIESRHGVAIAAHIDGNKGFLKAVAVGAVRQAIYRCRQLRAVEILDSSLRDDYVEGRKVGYERHVACVQSSDCWPKGADRHHLDGIGYRHTYLKMDEVCINGLRQAFFDPLARVRLANDIRPEPALAIEGLWVTGGFLNGQVLRLNSNLTCLIGGTGSGKSLTIELIRFALEQQTAIAKVDTDILRLLKTSLGEFGTVSVVLRKDADLYIVERAFGMPPGPSTVYKVVGGTPERLDDPIDLPTFFPIKAYSQTEIIEFARDGATRVSLTDDLIDLSMERTEIREIKRLLKLNAAQIFESYRQATDARAQLKELPGLDEEIERLGQILKDPQITDHNLWDREKALLGSAEQIIKDTAGNVPLTMGALKIKLTPEQKPEFTPSPTLFVALSEIELELSAAIARADADVLTALDKARVDLAAALVGWTIQYEVAEAAYQKLLRDADKDGRGIKALSERHRAHMRRRDLLTKTRDELDNNLLPRFRKLQADRDELLNRLQLQRRSTRDKRQQKAAELTKALDNRVRLRVDPEGARADYRDNLRGLQTGARLTGDQIVAIADKVHPIKLVKAMLSGKLDDIGRETGVDVDRLNAFRKQAYTRMDDLFETQILDVEDTIEVSLRLDGTTYKDIEDLAHGEKCTVILMVAMAEGDFPLIVDQPEDALHAPFIEENIVTTLRKRRGLRQYLFATRNANILVSGDAEQVIVMEATATSGRVVRTGSIDRFDTRDSVLLHLEGGEKAFDLRRLKYGLDPL